MEFMPFAEQGLKMQQGPLSWGSRHVSSMQAPSEKSPRRRVPQSKLGLGLALLHEQAAVLSLFQKVGFALAGANS